MYWRIPGCNSTYCDDDSQYSKVTQQEGKTANITRESQFQQSQSKSYFTTEVLLGYNNWNSVIYVVRVEML
jgi:hypothetical protein